MSQAALCVIVVQGFVMFFPYFTDEPSQKIGKNLISFVPP